MQLVRYIAIFLFVCGCATTKPSLENCMQETMKILIPDESVRKKEMEHSEVEMTLFIFCRQAKNDPELAAKYLDALRYTH